MKSDGEKLSILYLIKKETNIGVALGKLLQKLYEMMEMLRVVSNRKMN